MADVVGSLIALLFVGVALAIIIRKLLQDTRAEERERLKHSQEIAIVRSLLRCPCGAPATEGTPVLERGRGSVLRDLLSMPPRYRRVTPVGAPLVWCRAHAHVADAVLAEFVAQEVRSRLAQAYADIAARVAMFETEGLSRRVVAQLSDEQRKSGKRAA